VLAAEAGEISEIASVSFEGGGRLCAANIGLGFLNKGLKIARTRDQRESGFIHRYVSNEMYMEGEGSEVSGFLSGL
jgi:hypothetical protein